MAYRDILNKIVDTIEDLTIDDESIGQVRAYHQRAITPEEFETLFQISLDPQGKKPIRAWLVTWESARATRVGTTLNSYLVHHSFSILGWCSFNDNSEELMRRMAELILDTFATKVTLGLHDVSVSSTIVEDSGVSITGFRRENLGPVLCSHAELSIAATERHMSVEFE